MNEEIARRPSCASCVLAVLATTGCLEAADFSRDAAIIDKSALNAPNQYSASPPDGGACSVPGEILDLRNWRLTLPTPKSAGSTSAMSINQPGLLTFTDERFFHPTADCTGVVFDAPCVGVTTTNSAYPRAELRELMDGKSASWDVATGVHTMIITQAITHLPIAKPSVVAGQIHDDANDVVMIRLERTRLFVQGTSVSPVLAEPYFLGTKFTVKIVAGDGRIKVYYDDMTTPKTDFRSLATKCYFKAGAYTQSNVSKGDAPEAYGQVVIYDLKVTHE